VNSVKGKKRFASNSIKENLIYLNKGEQIINNHDYYNNVAIRVKDNANIMFSYQESVQEIDGLPYQMRSYDFNNIGVELVAEWYKRNLFIYRNIIENSESNDRVVIIIGSGHLYYLNQLLTNNPRFSLTNPVEVLAKTKNGH
jgi:aspartate oxidase